MMRLCSVALVLAAGLCAAADPAKWSAKSATVELPKELAEPVKALLSDKAVQVADADGKAVCDLWFRKSVPVKATAAEIQKGLNYRQVEQSEETLIQPATPSAQVGGPPGVGAGGAGNAAALTNQLLSAQRSLIQAQNQLYSIWINFQVARMQLYRDLELLPLDTRGVWNDEHTFCCGPDRPGTSGPPAGDAAGADREAGQPERLFATLVAARADEVEGRPASESNATCRESSGRASTSRRARGTAIIRAGTRSTSTPPIGVCTRGSRGTASPTSSAEPAGLRTASVSSLRFGLIRVAPR